MVSFAVHGRRPMRRTVKRQYVNKAVCTRLRGYQKDLRKLRKPTVGRSASRKEFSVSEREALGRQEFEIDSRPERALVRDSNKSRTRVSTPPTKRPSPIAMLLRSASRRARRVPKRVETTGGRMSLVSLRYFDRSTENS